MSPKLFILLLIFSSLPAAWNRAIRHSRQADDHIEDQLVKPSTDDEESDRNALQLSDAATSTDDCASEERSNHDVWADGTLIANTEQIDRDAELQSARQLIFDGALSRDQTIRVLEAALSICKRQRTGSARSSGDSQVTSQARRLLNLASDEINSASSESCADSPRAEPESFFQDPGEGTSSGAPGASLKRSINTKRIIIDLEKRGATEKTVQAKYPWYRRQYLRQFQEDVLRGGSHTDLHNQMESAVHREFAASRDRGLIIRGRDLRDWAIREAHNIGLTKFLASKGWLYNFQQRFGIGSRKITRRVSRSQTAQEAATRRSIIEFREQYARWSRYMPKPRVWNFDQTGFNYEPGKERTLSHRRKRYSSLNS